MRAARSRLPCDGHPKNENYRRRRFILLPATGSQAPAPPAGAAGRRAIFSFSISKGYSLRHSVHLALLAATLGAQPSGALAGEPLSDWLDGLGRSAQAASEGSEEAASFARRALAARPLGQGGDRARLALALALSRDGRDGERLKALRAAADVAPPAVRGALLEEIGEALADAGDPLAAAEAFRAAVAEGSPAVVDRARHLTAAALHAAGRHAEAVAAWRPLAGGRDAESLPLAERLDFARALRAAGDPTRAAGILRAIWTGLPERAEAEAAGADLVRWRSEGDPIPPFRPEERIDRAFRLIAMGRAPSAALELQEAAAATPAAPAGLLALARGTLHLAQGRPAEAEAEATPHLRSTHPGIRRGAQLLVARAAMRLGRIPEAIAAWRAVAAGRAPVPGLSPALQASLRDDAEFLSAWLPFETGELERAAAALERLARARPRSRRADDARWFASWAWIRLGDAARADAALRRLEGTSAPRSLYWRARIAADPAAREGLLRRAVAADPLGYYGLLACARLGAGEGGSGPGGEEGAARGDAPGAGGVARSRPLHDRSAGCRPPPLPAGPPPPELDRLHQTPLLRGAAALAAAGLRDEAVAELAAIASPRGNRPAGTAVAELASFLGDPLLPFRVTRDQLGLTRRSLPWGFPQAWPHWVRPAAGAARVDPALLLAVMRRESGFRTEARSPAGAVGLLQIIPGTAARLTSLLALPAPVAERLEEPEVNIPLGAAYLSLLQERFREPLLAVAAYNAGPGAVLRWQRERPDLPLDEWVESIPFRETREYVKAVVENWAGMRAAAGEAAPRLDPGAKVPAPGAGVGF